MVKKLILTKVLSGNAVSNLTLQYPQIFCYIYTFIIVEFCFLRWYFKVFFKKENFLTFWTEKIND